MRVGHHPQGNEMRTFRRSIWRAGRRVARDDLFARTCPATTARIRRDWARRLRMRMTKAQRRLRRVRRASQHWR